MFEKNYIFFNYAWGKRKIKPQQLEHVDKQRCQKLLLKGFKGKGEEVSQLIKQQCDLIDSLHNKKEQSHLSMLRLVEKYDETFDSPRVVNLRVGMT